MWFRHKSRFGESDVVRPAVSRVLIKSDRRRVESAYPTLPGKEREPKKMFLVWSVCGRRRMWPTNRTWEWVMMSIRSLEWAACSTASQRG